MSNTVIIDHEGKAINSEKYETYGLKIDKSFVPTEDGPPIRIALIAITENKTDEVLIAYYGEREDACYALLSLIEAVDAGERIWDVFDHHSDL